MQAQTIQLIGITPSDLIDIISQGVASGKIKIKEETKPLNYSKKEFAQKIGKSTSFVDQMRREGKLQWKRIGGTVRIPSEELKKYS